MQTNSRWTLMPSNNGNSSVWWVSIRRNASCYESPERNLQWRRPTWYMDTHLETDTAKYLGVSLHKHSSWSPHVNATAKKANGTRAFLQRNLRKAPTAVKKRTYESLIHPILEYSGVVWDPHTAQDVNKLEMVQRRYARYTSRDYGRTSSVTAMLKILGWEPLAERRAKARITMMHRIVHGLVDIMASDHILLAPASRRTGNAQFRVPYARTLAYQRGFFPDGTHLWNALPNEVTEAESIDTFKERLSQLRVRCWDHSSTL